MYKKPKASKLSNTHNNKGFNTNLIHMISTYALICLSTDGPLLPASQEITDGFCKSRGNDTSKLLPGHSPNLNDSEFKWVPIEESTNLFQSDKDGYIQNCHWHK